MTVSVDEEDVSTRVVDAVAEREGVDPVELTSPLDDVVDPEALDALYATKLDGTRRAGCRVEFQYYGYDVTVHPDGTVTVTDAG